MKKDIAHFAVGPPKSPEGAKVNSIGWSISDGRGKPNWVVGSKILGMANTRIPII